MLPAASATAKDVVPVARQFLSSSLTSHSDGDSADGSRFSVPVSVVALLHVRLLMSRVCAARFALKKQVQRARAVSLLVAGVMSTGHRLGSAMRPRGASFQASIMACAVAASSVCNLGPL